MSYFLGLHRTLTTSCAIVIISGALAAHAAMDPRFELDEQSLGGPKQNTRSSLNKERRIARRTSVDKSNEGGSASGSIYVVKQGDYLFKILMRDYGLSNDEAEALVEEIRRDNNIANIRNLKVGQKILIPSVLRKAHRQIRPGKSVKDNAEVVASADYQPVAAGQVFRLESMVPAVSSSQDPAMAVKEVWGSLIPSKGEYQKPLILKSPTFSLTLDPERYPVFAAMDGGRILLDQGSTIPPLVKSLIEEKDPTVRIVSESPANGRRFLSAMLGVAGFYSVEENFTMEFGTDPKLVVRSDFKVEKTPESLIKQDVVLLNSGKTAMPQPLGDFLKDEGFTVYEPFASLKPYAARTPSRQIHQINAKGQTEITDAILNSLEVPYQADRHVDVFAADNNGISLSVKAERFFERDGQRFVITSFDGDPVTYTLFRILETKGYRVVILEPKDDFRKVSEKIISRLRIQGSYAQHKLWPEDVANYSLLMSGFNLEGAGIPGGSLFLTNLQLDRIVRDLLKENGYNVNVK